MTVSLLSVIDSKFDTFSKGQKKIAKFVAEHYETAAFMTAAKMGETVKVSESTVVRFATELGYKGYPEFQKDLQDLIRSKLTGVQRIDVFDARTKGENIVENTMKNDSQLLINTMQAVSKENFDASVKTIMNAKKIYILGVRSAAFLAGFLSYYFKLIFDNVVLINVSSDSELYEEIFRINKDDVCIAISMPRYSALTIRAVRFMKDRGVNVIAITDNINAPIARMSDYVLEAKSGMASIVDSLVAPLSLLNALIAAITLEKGAELRENYEALEQIWDQYEVYDKFEETSDNV